MAYDKPGWAKRIEALEAVRDDMKANVLTHQYLHNTRHYIGGDDPLRPVDIGAADRVHKHSYTDITDLQAMINGYAPGTNPEFPNGIGGIKDLDLTELANRLKNDYALGGGRMLVSNPNASADGNKAWCHVLHNCTPGKMLYIVTRSDRQTIVHVRWGGGTVRSNLSQLVSGLATPQSSYTQGPHGLSLDELLALCEKYNGQFLAPVGDESTRVLQSLAVVTCCKISGVIEGMDSDANTTYAYDCRLTGTLIVSPTVRVVVGVGEDWGTWYELWEA